MEDPFKVTEEANTHRDFKMLSLSNVGMAASAVKFYIPFHPAEMFFMIEGDAQFCKDDL